MMTQPVLTTEDCEQQMQELDITAPPVQAELFESMMGGLCDNIKSFFRRLF
jgi:hypothetical protein